MSAPPIFIVSGGAGASGQQLARTALAQFEGAHVPIEIVPHVQQIDQLEDVVQRAVLSGGIIVHTLVDADLRSALVELTRERSVTAIDLIGPLLLHLTRILDERPIGQPGLYRQLREDYFKRIEAIEFTVDHDDGRKPHELGLAEIVIAGVSRVGKTPLSMYLSTRGWKVANVPLVREIAPPAELFEIDARRVVGLTIDEEQLAAYRRRRGAKLGLAGQTAYTDHAALYEETAFAQAVFRRGRFAVVDITDKPIEESADEVVEHVVRRLRQNPGEGG